MYVEKVFTETLNGRKLHDLNAPIGKIGKGFIFLLVLLFKAVTNEY